MNTYAALLRGINVGKAKRIAMADLRSLVEALGHTRVRTLLNSGNVVFDAPAGDVARLAAAIEAAIVARVGFQSKVVVVARSTMDDVVEQNPLAALADDPSRLLVAFVRSPATLAELTPLAKRDWAPEALAVGTGAAYLWCPQGVLSGQVMNAAGRVLGDQGTTRNWATVLKLHALMSR